MSHDYELVRDVLVFSAERQSNTRNGNPMFLFRTSRGNFRLSADVSFGYSVDNLTNTRHPATYAIGDDAQPVDLVVTGSAPRVVGMQRNGEWLR